MSENLQVTILKKQNTQLAARIDNYRKLNKELTQRNQGLNTWSVNMASVLSSIEAAFKVFLTNEETLFQLIKPKGNKEPTAIVAKCVSHFKHFNQILSNLAHKVNENERSNQFTKEAKQGIEALVSSYEMFFKEFLKSYFANNEKYQEWLGTAAAALEAVKSSDLRDQFRDLLRKEKQNQVVIKEFSLYFQELRGKLPAYQKQNQTLFLGDLLKKKNEEMDQLTEKNIRLSHRFRTMMDYNPTGVNQALIDTENFACVCGGVQIQYTKERWEQTQVLQQQERQRETTNQNAERGMDSEERKIFENQIEELVKQNVVYLNRNQQLKIENSIEESIFKSHAYETLLKQTQELVKYCGTLQKTIHELKGINSQMQAAREKEIKQLRAKYESERSTGQAPVVRVKTESYAIVDSIKSAFSAVIAKIEENAQWEQKEQKIEKSIRESIEKVRIESEAAYRKYEDMLKREEKVAEVEPKRESHKILIKQVEGYLPKDGLLEKFNEYIKDRQRKVESCEKHIRKLEKELAIKVTLCDNMKNSLLINEGQFTAMSAKNAKLQEALKSLDEFTRKIYSENIEAKNTNQRDRYLLELKLKSESEINSAYQIKVKTLEEKLNMLKDYPTIYDRYIKNQQAFVAEMKNRIIASEEECAKANELLNATQSKLREYEKSEKRYTEDNERLRSKLNAIKRTEVQNTQESSYEEKMSYALIELEEFKGKYYCSCQKDRKVEVSLKTCPHVFCRNCVEDVNKTRSRACPICRVKFSRGDINYMKWT